MQSEKQNVDLQADYYNISTSGVAKGLIHHVKIRQQIGYNS